MRLRQRADEWACDNHGNDDRWLHGTNQRERERASHVQNEPRTNPLCLYYLWFSLLVFVFILYCLLFVLYFMCVIAHFNSPPSFRRTHSISSEIDGIETEWSKIHSHRKYICHFYSRVGLQLPLHALYFFVSFVSLPCHFDRNSSERVSSCVCLGR